MCLTKKDNNNKKREERDKKKKKNTHAKSGIPGGRQKHKGRIMMTCSAFKREKL